MGKLRAALFVILASTLWSWSIYSGHDYEYGMASKYGMLRYYNNINYPWHYRKMYELKIKHEKSEDYYRWGIFTEEKRYIEKYLHCPIRYGKQIIQLINNGILLNPTDNTTDPPLPHIPNNIPEYLFRYSFFFNTYYIPCNCEYEGLDDPAVAVKYINAESVL
ncbi:hypothetical protein [Dysgonomonas macrotermitis]|uniref:Uncharacterized protein n=1 Tax=Dysgonomonas macrotermitis TaxID=1346286 RepID=A0A1M5HIW0_9BACT|nr:hypothetical protein [Dysgonomonas macrotermitis]SHG15909.1 hypothetical protein SAMN05444362_11680 [Dysgonomonas macrotermitis]